MRFEDAIREREAVLAKTREKLAGAFEHVADVVVEAIRGGRKIYFFGNGGSAADAQHLATELIDRLILNRAPLPALALTTNTSLLTSISNDKAFAQVFSRQVEAYARPGDILVGISTSGGSENVLEAFRAGRAIGTVNVGFCGEKGWKEGAEVDHPLAVPSNDTQLIQEVHIGLGHLLCFAIEDRLFA